MATSDHNSDMSIVCLVLLTMLSGTSGRIQSAPMPGLIPVQSTPLQERLSFDAELANVRALPFGYSAICEAGDLKIKSETSATFVIRDSLLCELRTPSVEIPRERLVILCSNNPKHHRDEKQHIPKCNELVIERTEI